jgi:hypothetical protein
VALGAALVMERALAQPARAAPLEHALAEAARTALRDRRVPGSKWALAGTCGADVIEGDPLPPTVIHDGNKTLVVLSVSCGMGSLPASAHRFLHFYTKATGAE